jgi:hypothetical protein
MHETLSPNFKGYIDNFFIEGDNLRFSGWIVTTNQRENVVYYLDNGNNIAFFNYNERPDVASFYNTNDINYLKSGFDITIPKTNTTNCTVFALVKGQKEVLFNLSLDSSVNTVESRFVDETFNVSIRNNIVPEIVVVDNFYSNPDEVRAIALEQQYAPDIRYHKGQRTSKKFIAQGTKQIFESLLCKKITNWVEYEYNGIFQFCTAEDPLVYHSDVQSYAGAIYLTPDAPVETGTSFYRSKKFKEVRKCHVNDSNYGEVFMGGFYDKTNFELIDSIGNVYNRLTLWNAKLIHSASQYFGTEKNNSRLFHLFFFDIEE